MMLPSLLPMLMRYREAVAGERRLGRRTALVGAGYFFVWTVVGIAAFPVGAALAEIAMRHDPVSRAMPLVAGGVVVAAGLLQLTAWKARRLTCCREAPASPSPAGGAAAWRHGLDLGIRCVRCCANLMAIGLVLGVMDLRAMAAVTIAITAERVAPAGAAVPRTVGAVVVGAGALLILRAAGLG